MKINQYLNLSLTKYKVLDEILPNYSKRMTAITIYVDIRSILGVLFTDYGKNLALELKATEKVAISASLINLVAHYKNYFKKVGLDTEFILFHHKFKDDYDCKDSEIYPDFNKHLYKTRNMNNDVSKIINDNFDILSEIVSRLPGIYFIQTSFSEHVIPYIIKNDFSSTKYSLILTNNQMFATYVNYNCNILTLKREQSKILNYKNIVDVFLKKVSSKVSADFNGRLIAILLGIYGVEKHSLPGWKRYGIVTATKYLNKEINSSTIPKNLIVNYQTYKESLEKVITFPNQEFTEILDRNLQLIDPEQYYTLISDSDLYEIEKQLDKNLNYSDLYNLNHTYFKNQPIKLEMLAY